MYKVRTDEPKYAFLWDKETKVNNCYGHSIEKTPENSPLRNQSLNINGDSGIGENPNRYKQHGDFLIILVLNRSTYQRFPKSHATG